MSATHGERPSPRVSRTGLTTTEAGKRLREVGPNVTAEARPRPWRTLAAKLWAPVPWMLELTIVLELGKPLEAGIVVVFLGLNAVISFVQEDRARAALDLLRQRLTVSARVLRDGGWQTIASRRLVPGD